MFLKASIKLISVPENPGFGKYPSPWPPNVIHFSLLAVCCCNCGRYIIELLSVLRIGASYFQSANIPKFIALGPNLHLFVKKFQICSQEIFLEFLSLFDLVRICVRSVMVRRIFLGQDCEKFTTSSRKILQEETLLYNVETVGKITESPSTTYYFKETLKGISTR